MKSLRFVHSALFASILMSLAVSAGAQEKAGPAQDKAATPEDKAATFRRFTGTDGKSFYAVVTAKTASSVTFKLQNGKTVTQSLRSLSEPDRLFVQKWTKFKNDLLNNAEFASLKVQELLELRGYQSFEYVIEGNHIYVEGELTGAKVKLMIDTGAHSSMIHGDFAKEAKLEIGPYDQKVYGVAGSQDAAVTKISVLKIGDAVISGRRILATDLTHGLGGNPDCDMIFGADFLRELDAVISYGEGRMFLKTDNIGKAAKPDPNAAAGAKAEFRLWTAAEGGRSFSAALADKTATEATFRMPGDKLVKLALDKLSENDREYIGKWSKLRDDLTKNPEWRTLTVKELLELRAFQSFVYRLEGNHILVDGTVTGPSGDTKARFMIDTGAHGCVMDYKWAKEVAKLEVGTLGETKIRGFGGEADAAFTKLKSLKMGDAIVNERIAVSSEIHKRNIGGEGIYDALFGAEFLRELDAVISYKEGRMFLKPDNSDRPAVDGKAAPEKTEKPEKVEPAKEEPKKEEK